MDYLLAGIALALGLASGGWLAIVAIVISVITTVYSYTVAQKAGQGSQDGVLITKQDNNAGLPIIYGERRVGGTKVWKNVSKDTFLAGAGRTTFGQGDPNDGVGVDWKAWTFLDRVDVIGEGPIEGVTDIIVDNITYKAPRFRERNQAIYRGIFMDGDPAQGSLTELVNKYPEWNASSVGTRVAYMNSRFRSGHYHSEGYDSYYQGEPNCEYQVKGKLVYDPRKDVAYGGTGSHVANDESTWEWSDNPALCLLDYLRGSYGRDLDISQIHVGTFIGAANSCDEIVTVPPRLENDTGGNVVAWNPVTGEWVDVSTGEAYPHYRPDQVGITQKRLTCNAVLEPDNSVLENVKTLLQSMRGSLPYANGKYSLILEAPTASSMTFTPEDIIGGINFGNGDRSKRYNRVSVVFPNKNKNYREDRVSWPKLNSAEHQAYLSEDNGEPLFYEVQLDAITDYYQAEDIAEFICRDSRQQLAAEVKVKSKGIQIQPGDVVGITHPTPGWTDRYFRVRRVAINSDMTALLSLQEYNASTYDWAATENEPDQPDVNLPLPSDTLLPVTDLRATVTRRDTAKGVPAGNVELSWIPPEETQPREYVTRYIKQGGVTGEVRVVTPALLGADGRATSSFIAPESGVTYTVAVEYFTQTDRKGPSATGAVSVPQYTTDLEQEIDNIETEAGQILERDDGLGGFIPADLSDLAKYYKDQEHDIDTELAATNTALNTQIARLDSDVAQLVTQLGDITSGVADVYVQATPPVPGVGGIPDPISSNARWYDSDDGNHPYIWNGSSWDSIQDGSVGQNSAAITALQSSLTTTDGNVSANAAAISVTDTTVTDIDGRVTSNTSDITTLKSTVDDPVTGVNATSTALGGLTTTVTQQGADIASNASDVTLLQSTVNHPTTGVAANAGAVTGLDTRVTAAEGTISTQSSEITSLRTDLTAAEGDVAASTSAVSGLTTRIETAENDIDTLQLVTTDTTALQNDLQYRVRIEPEGSNRPGQDNEIDFEDGSGGIELENDLSYVVAASVSAQNSLRAEIDRTEEGIKVISEDITTLNSKLDIANGQIAANGNATSALSTIVDQNGDDISIVSSDVTTLTAELANAVTGVNANGSAINALTTRVEDNEDGLTVASSDITSLDTRLTTAEGDLIAGSTATDALTTRVTAAEGSISTNATKLTSLESDLTTAEGNISGNATAVEGLATRVTAAEGTITSEATKLVDLTASLATTDGVVAAQGTAATALTTRVTATEGSIQSQSQSITSLTSDLAATNGDVAAAGSAIAGLQTDVSAIDGVVTSHTSSISSLSAQLTTAEGDISNAVNIANSASATASAAADGVVSLQANWQVVADVNGRISGIKLESDANASKFTVVANDFLVYNNNTGTGKPVFGIYGTKIALNGDVVVNGSLIVNGTITSDELGNNCVGSDELVISAGAGDTGERMYFDGNNNRIAIYDSNNNVRVLLGKLT